MNAKRRATLVVGIIVYGLLGGAVGYKVAFDYQERRRLECGAAWYQTMGALEMALERIDALTAAGE
jgi:hypothetical protein